MQPQPADAAQPQPKPEATRGGSWLTTLIIVAVMLILAAVAFFIGFRLATDSSITVGELLRFIRQLYQWFGAG